MSYVRLLFFLTLFLQLHTLNAAYASYPTDAPYPTYAPYPTQPTHVIPDYRPIFDTSLIANTKLIDTTITTTIPNPTIYQSQLRYTDIAILSQLMHSKTSDYQTLSKVPLFIAPNIASTASYRTPSYGDPYIEHSHAVAAAQNLAEEQKAQRAARILSIQEERNHIRAKKEMYVCPAQWGDYFPTTKPLFAYLGWREDEDVIREREKFNAAQQTQIIACQGIASLIAQAITHTSNEKSQKSMQFLINISRDCDQFNNTDNKNNEQLIDANNLYKQNQNHSSNNYKNNTTTQRIDDVTDAGIRYKQYVFSNEKGEYDSGYLESYDGKHVALFKLYKPISLQLNKTLAIIKNFHTYHEHSIVTTKVNYIKNTPQYQKNQVDILYHLGKITDQQAIQRYQQIEYVSELRRAQTAVKQFEKSQNPSWIRQSLNYITGTNNHAAHHDQIVTTNNNNQTQSTTPVNHTTQQQSPVNTLLPITTSEKSPNLIPQPVPDTTEPQRLSPAQAIVANIIHNQQSHTRPQLAQLFNGAKTDTQTIINKYKTNKKLNTEQERHTLLEAHDKWIQNNIHLAQTDNKENSMLHYMLDTIALAENDTKIEIAQSGLRSWEQLQQAKYDEEKTYHSKRFQQYYRAIQYEEPIQSIAQQAQPMQYYEIDNLLQDYTTALTTHTNTATSQSLSPIQKESFERLEKRAHALEQTKKQMYTNKQSHHTYELSAQAREFMLTNNMNHAAFDGENVTEYQHCLTQEILNVIESSANIAHNHGTQSTIGQIAHHNCNLAIAAQQLNQGAHIEQATALTDISIFFEKYAQLLVDSGLHSQATMDLTFGMIDGTAQALRTWSNFLKDLTCQPRQTIGKMVSDYQAIGTTLYQIAGKACEFMPHAYLNDAMLDMQESLARMQRNSPSSNKNQLRRTQQRTERNAQLLQDGLHGAVQVAQSIIEGMMQKTLRQNVAMGTEIIVDNMIINKATDCILKLSCIVGSQALHIADQFHSAIPTELFDAKPIFMPITNTGELFAIADTTGESIGAAIAAKKLTDGLENAAKTALYAKNSFDKTNGSSNNSQKITPTDPYTYKNGKYKASAKHHANSPDNIGKPPRDGQAALDNSLVVEKSRERITVQDGKIVVLKYEEFGVYHGYIVEDFFSIRNESVQQALVKNGLVNSMKGGKVIK